MIPQGPSRARTRLSARQASSPGSTACSARSGRSKPPVALLAPTPDRSNEVRQAGVHMIARGLLLLSLVVALILACGGTASYSMTGTASTVGGQRNESPLKVVRRMDGNPNPFVNPDGLALDRHGNLYVADSGNNRIHKLDSQGRLITKWGSHGGANGQFSCGEFCGVAVDGRDNVYVTDHDNFRVQKFDSNGNFLGKWGSLGRGDGQFTGPFGVAVDRQGNVYVGDGGTYRVQKFDSNGKFLAKWGSFGTGPGRFSDLSDIAVDARGNVYVSDRSNGFQKFDRNRRFVAKWDKCGDSKLISATTGVAVDTRGNIYVYDISNNRICKYDGNGRFLA